MGGDISIPVGGGNKLRVSWNDDGNDKIDASERESVNVEIKDSGNVTIATPINPNDTASRLSIKLFQAIDKAEGQLMGSDDNDTATPNQITKGEIEIAARTFQKVADTMVNQDGQSVDIQTVIADFNAPDSSGDGAVDDGDFESAYLLIEGKPEENGERFQAFQRFAEQHQSNPAVVERGYNRLISSISGLRGNLQILDAIFKGYLKDGSYDAALRVLGEYNTSDDQADRAKQLIDKILGLADSRYNSIILAALEKISANYIPGTEARQIWSGESVPSFIDRVKHEIATSPAVRLAMVKVFEYKRTEKGWAWAPKENLTALESAQSNLAQIIRDELEKPRPDKTLVADAWHALAQCLMVQGFSQWDNDVDINPDRPKEAALQTFQKAAAVFRAAMDQYADLVNLQSLEAKSRYFERQRQNSAGSIAGLAYLPLHMRRGSHLGEKEVGGESKKRKDFLKAWACLLIAYLPETTNTVVVYRGGIRDWREHPEGYPVPQAGNAMALYINLAGGAKGYDRKYLTGKGLSNYGIKSGSNSYRVQAEQMTGITPIKTD